MTDALLDRTLDAVADRQPVDWDAIEREANSDDDREWLECLRVIAGIGDLHADSEEIPETTDDDDTREIFPGQARVGQPSSMWGRYRLVEQVGEGGFGRVHRAWDPELEREVAIKILHPRIGDRRLKDNLLSEGRALARVRHPNVVSVLGVESHDDRVGLCMEFVHGETLEDVLQRGMMTARDAAVMGEDVCRALAAVHLAGFVHRDVKARNVMRDADGRVVLMDFGAGQQADQLKMSGRASVVGTPLYMAPEVLSGQPATACSDVYSVGVLLYRMTTGAYPVEGDSLEEIASAHMQGRRVALKERRPELPSAFVKVVERALTANPAKRYRDATALLEALGSITRALSPAAKAAVGALSLVAAVLIVQVSGVAATVAFDRTLGRTAPFNGDPWWVIFDIGWRSLVPPIVYITLMVLGLWIAGFVWRLARLMPWCDRAARGVGERLKALVKRMEFDDPLTFSSGIVTVATVALAAIVWNFSGLLDAAVAATISDQPAERLLPLRPGHAGFLYRICLEALMLLLGLSILHVVRRASASRKRRALALLSVPLVIVVLMAQLPYRLLWHNQAPRVSVDSERCYVLGEDGRQALIFCPDRTPPRNRVVDVQMPGFRRLGIVESIFSAPDTSR